MNWEIRIDIYILPCITYLLHIYVYICIRPYIHLLLHSTKSSAWCSVMTWRGGMVVGVGGRSKRKEIRIHIADSLHFTAETNTTL